MANIITSALALILAGCVHAYDSYSWVKAADVPQSTIRLVADTSICEPDQLACARITGRDCTIYVRADMPALIGHEAAHCFGWRH